MCFFQFTDIRIIFRIFKLTILFDKILFFSADWTQQRSRLESNSPMSSSAPSQNRSNDVIPLQHCRNVTSSSSHSSELITFVFFALFKIQYLQYCFKDTLSNHNLFRHVSNSILSLLLAIICIFIRKLNL